MWFSQGLGDEQHNNGAVEDLGDGQCSNGAVEQQNKKTSPLRSGSVFPRGEFGHRDLPRRACCGVTRLAGNEATESEPFDEKRE